jgi:hypothetical protein
MYGSSYMFHSLLCLRLPSGLLTSGFPTENLYTPLLAPKRSTSLAHIILLGLITRTIFGDKYSSVTSSFCIFHHSPAISSLLGPNTLLNTLFSNTLKPTFLPQCERPSFTPIQNNRQPLITFVLFSVLSFGFIYNFRNFFFRPNFGLSRSNMTEVRLGYVRFQVGGHIQADYWTKGKQTGVQ